MDLNDLEKKIDKDCVAVIPVHNAGHPVPMDKLMEIAKVNNLKVIEDCAHSAGGVYKNKRLGTWGDIGCFSFEEKKCMTTGDGGMICSNDIDLIKPLRAFRWVGIDKDTWKREEELSQVKKSDAYHWHYEISVLRYKYNMNDVMASMRLAQLKKLDYMNENRNKTIKVYLDAVNNINHIIPYTDYNTDGDFSYWFWYQMQKKR